MAQPPAWVRQYIGAPFLENGRTPDGWDCWGCMRWVMDKHFGIRVPAYDGVTWHRPPEGLSDRERLAFCASQTRELNDFVNTTMILPWRKVDHPGPGCGIQMKPWNQPIHVGVVVARGWMLHCEEECNTVCVEYDGILWCNRVTGFYEWAG